ncbi:MAG: DUF928 domain-containing protein [Stigonema ocellatum SAG 48.90 = DSM 106950]|nr:DUF928 domain-containing protein [Stigonema ocellatum SAG 48.90 = DSM 106950]
MKLILTIALILSFLIQQHASTAQTQQPATTKQPVQPSTGATSTQQPTSRPIFVLPKTPTRLSPISGRRAGMGSRDSCPAVPTALTALVPLQEEQKVGEQTDKSIIGIVGGLTTSERPTFWFYVPYTQDLANLRSEFILQNSMGKDVYKHAQALPPKPGVIGIPLPNTVTSLEVGHTYHWYLKVYCQQTVSVPVYVEGDIERVKIDSRVMQQLAADTRQKILIYAKQGIWFDALTMLAQKRLSNPNDASVKDDWQSLLQSVNLGNIATAPLVNLPNRQ